MLDKFVLSQPPLSQPSVHGLGPQQVANKGPWEVRGAPTSLLVDGWLLVDVGIWAGGL
jgi:hypothetical protein